jgi:hypothetical protein
MKTLIIDDDKLASITVPELDLRSPPTN